MYIFYFFFLLQDGSLILYPTYYTSFQARFADLPASPAGLLGRFAPSGSRFAYQARFALASRSLHLCAFCAYENFGEKKCLDQLKML